MELDKLEYKLIYCERVLDDFVLKVEKLFIYIRVRKVAEEIINKVSDYIKMKLNFEF